jgi:putative ABC transport system substrate-binding protein
MRRRDFITSTLLTAAIGRGAYGQAARLRRIGLMNGLSPDDPQGSARLAAFSEDLEAYGWKVGRDVQLEPRWFGGDLDVMRRHAAELVALTPDVIVSASDPALAALRDLTRTIPVVFLVVADPVGNGFVESLARPGGNLTGVGNAEPRLAGKWIDLLREIVPSQRGLALLVHPESLSTRSFGRAIAAAAQSVALPTRSLEVHGPGDVEPAIRAAAAEAGSSLIVLPSTVTSAHGRLIAEAAMRHRVPAIYPFTQHAVQGGLISYGVNITSVWRGAPWYVDRILRGAEPGALPVQEPASFELAINLRAARAIGLEIPPALLARADEVIE